MMMEWKRGSRGDERGPFEVSARRLMGPARIVKLPLFYRKPLSLSLSAEEGEGIYHKRLMTAVHFRGKKREKKR